MIKRVIRIKSNDTPTMLPAIIRRIVGAVASICSKSLSSNSVASIAGFATLSAINEVKSETAAGAPSVVVSGADTALFVSVAVSDIGTGSFVIILSSINRFLK